MIKNKFLFNFSASYSGGGFKRLYAYVKWFNQNGGAWFIVNERCCFLQKEFKENHFFSVNPSKFQRLLNDCHYLPEIIKEIGYPDLYYSYGIPIYYDVGRLNWFHISNVLPFNPWSVPLPLLEKMKLSYLGRKMEHNFKNADIISAESNFSLGLVHQAHAKKCFLSVNGSDDEMFFNPSQSPMKKENIAVILGTYSYKALEDSYRIFEMLCEKNSSALKLIIIGDEKRIPKPLRMNKEIITTGYLQRSDVVEYLCKAKYYISTTHIENSYNAAAEGVFFADESYISDIGPHRELIMGMPFEKMTVSKMLRPVLYVKREDISPLHLKSWDRVIVEMVGNVSK